MSHRHCNDKAMGHSVTALLGSRSVLSAFATAQHLQQPVECRAGAWLLPLTDDAIDTIVGLPVGDPPSGFTYLFPKLVAALERASAPDWIVYVETAYFGGVGRQGAAAFVHGALVYGPTVAESACINAALARVGIRIVALARDEFDTVGLGAHRFTDDWLSTGDDVQSSL